MYLKIFDQSISLLRGRASAKKYLVNTSWLAVERLVRMVLALLVGVWVARFLGPERFGLLSYAQSMVGLFGAIATLGLDSIVTRELVNDTSKRDSILGTAFFLKLIGGFLALLFLWFSISITPNDAYTKLIVFIVASSTILQCFNVIDLHFQSIVQSKYVVFANFVASLLSSLVKVLLVLHNASLEAFAFTAVLDQILIAIGLVYFYKKQNLNFKNWHFDLAIAKPFLKYSWPLILSSISISIGMRIDQVMLKSLLDEKSVGLYAVGVKLAEVFNFIPMIIAQSFYPKIVKIDLEKERNKLINLTRFIFYLLVLLGVFVNLVSFITIHFLYGQEYLPSQIVLDILIWSIPITFLNIITNNILLKLNNSKLILGKQVSLAGINILLNLLLIPKFGIAGAAFATLLADFSILFFELFFTGKKWIFYLRLQSVFFIPAKRKVSP